MQIMITNLAVLFLLHFCADTLLIVFNLFSDNRHCSQASLGPCQTSLAKLSLHKK